MINIELSFLDDVILPQELEQNQLKNVAKKITQTLLCMDEIKNNCAILDNDFSDLNFEFSFCNDETIRQINRDYRKKDAATDVITFALYADDENSLIIERAIELGEIIISVDTALRQAKENGVTIEIEIYTLITHGILHLLGFDHLTIKDYDFVVDIQNKVIRTL